MNGRIAEELKRDLFIFHDEAHKDISKLSKIYGATILDQVFDQLDPKRKNLRDILNELRNEIKTGGSDPIPFPVLSVNGKTGEVVLDPSDIGLSNVNNTADIAKPLSIPQKEAIMTILQNYHFNINLSKYDKHLLDTNNPHDVSVAQLDRDQELTNLINLRVAHRLHTHATSRSLFVHRDIREAINAEKLKIDDLLSNWHEKIPSLDREIAELFRMTTLHDEELSKREIVKNKVNVFQENINNNHQYYPSTRAVIEYLRARLHELNLITADDVISDIRVIRDLSELPKANKDNYRCAYVMQNGRGSKTEIAICRREDNFYFWEIADIGAYSKFDDRFFYDSSKGLTLNLQAIFNAITTGEGLLQEVYSTEGRDVLSGFNGYTYSIGNHNALGEVNTIIFTIPFKVVKASKPVVRIAGNFKAQMGDGSIIGLHNPIIEAVTNTAAMVQFTMREWYPSDSPAVLMFADYGSKITVDGALNAETQTEDGFSIEEYFAGGSGNTLAGFYGMTVENTPSATGDVSTVLVSIPFKRAKEIKPDISIAGNFKTRMGDGSFISLYDPSIVELTTISATIAFKMKTPYPSNSPCMLCYADENALIKVKGRDKLKILDPDKFYKPLSITCKHSVIPHTGGKVSLILSFDSNISEANPVKPQCDCNQHLLSFNNIRSINILPGSMSGCIRYYVNNDMATMTELRIPGLHTMAFQEFLVDSNIPNMLIQERHLGNGIITTRMITEKAVEPRHVKCQLGAVMGNLENLNSQAEEVSIGKLYTALREYGEFHPGGAPAPTNPYFSPHLCEANKIYRLPDKSNICRFTGEISVLPNMETNALLSSDIKINKYRLLDAGGTWYYSTNPDAQAILGGSNITGFTFGTIIMNTTGLYFVTISTGNRMNAPYDIWIRFYDPSDI